MDTTTRTRVACCPQPNALGEYRRIHWHLQFHLGILAGRDPDYAEQRTSQEFMREIFLHALRRIPDHPIHLYCTTRELTAQYQVPGRRTVSNVAVHPLFLLPSA